MNTKTDAQHTPTPPWKDAGDTVLIWEGNAYTPYRKEFIVRAVNRDHAFDALLEKLKHAQARIFVHEGNSGLYDDIGNVIDQAEAK